MSSSLGMSPDDEDDGLILRGEHRGDERPRAAALGARQRGDRGPHLPQAATSPRASICTWGGWSTRASSDPDERLGEDLLLRGKITVRQYLEASQLIRPGRRLGTILVELGALEAEDLMPARSSTT